MYSLWHWLLQVYKIDTTDLRFDSISALKYFINFLGFYGSLLLLCTVYTYFQIHYIYMYIYEEYFL